MKFLALMAVLFCACLVNAPLQSQQPATALPQSNRVVNIDLALVSSIRDIEVPARVKGFISQVRFREGDLVQKGEILSLIHI